MPCWATFAFLREISRGGMGIVYEAEQVSLSRRVALKVLPFAALLDQRQLQRFKNEAHTAAVLRHSVDVTDAGCHSASTASVAIVERTAKLRMCHLAWAIRSWRFVFARQSICPPQENASCQLRAAGDHQHACTIARG